MITSSIPGLSWRSLQGSDVGAVAQRAGKCLEADGGLPLEATDTYTQEHYLSAWPGPSIGAFEADGRLIACATVQPTNTPDDYRVIIVGQVHPTNRKRGASAIAY